MHSLSSEKNFVEIPRKKQCGIGFQLFNVTVVWDGSGLQVEFSIKRSATAVSYKKRRASLFNHYKVSLCVKRYKGAAQNTLQLHHCLW